MQIGYVLRELETEIDCFLKTIPQNTIFDHAEKDFQSSRHDQQDRLSHSLGTAKKK